MSASAKRINSYIERIVKNLKLKWNKIQIVLIPGQVPSPYFFTGHLIEEQHYQVT